MEDHFDGLVTRSTYSIPVPLAEHALYDQVQLSVLRLVNKRFERLTRPMFWRRVDYTDDASSTSVPTTDFSSLVGLSQSYIGHHVHELVVGIVGNSHIITSDMEYGYYRALIQVLPQLLEEFTSLKTLTIVGPELTSCVTITSPVSRATARLVTDAVNWVFKERVPLAPGDNPFWHMPQCQPAVFQGPMMLESVIMNMSQTIHFPSSATTVAAASPRSDSENYYSDRHYEEYLFPFLRLALNLRHLCLRFGHLRNLQLNQLDCSRFERLEILQLSGFTASFEHLMALLGRNEGTLRAVELQLVQLSSGDWEQVFVFLDASEALEQLFIVHCSYL